MRVLWVVSLNLSLALEEKKKMYDLKAVALSLTAEYMSIDSWNSLFKQLNGDQIQYLMGRS